MPASEREFPPSQQSTAEPLTVFSSASSAGSARTRPAAPSMRELLASCAAAEAVSTPPRERDPGMPSVSRSGERRDAA
ncbi:hypothetical protein [Streptomyces albipurpureus]|uniref:hypothetical protein n=1 Tax=Streptomyces albipurpureus TaxID=2897419 RepID=UPI0027E581E4|nr:hypothetical protein [Streptomyces sp. CWNU-1]